MTRLPAGARAEILTDVAAQLGEFTSLVGDLVQLSRDDMVTPSPEPTICTSVGKEVAAKDSASPSLRAGLMRQAAKVS